MYQTQANDLIRTYSYQSQTSNLTSPRSGKRKRSGTDNTQVEKNEKNMHSVLIKFMSRYALQETYGIN